VFWAAPQNRHPEFLSASIVHLQNLNGRTTFGRDPLKHRTIHVEVFVPAVRSRMKERHDLSRHGIDSR